MTRLFEMNRLFIRIRPYAEREGLRPEAGDLPEKLYFRGEAPRGEAEAPTGLKERTARSRLNSLVRIGIIGSDTVKGPISLRFPRHAAEFLFPGLFPET